MLSLIPKDKVESISNEVSKKVMEHIGKELNTEFKKVEAEFDKMAKYINSLEDRVEQLEKKKKQGD